MKTMPISFISQQYVYIDKITFILLIYKKKGI